MPEAPDLQVLAKIHNSKKEQSPKGAEIKVDKKGALLIILKSRNYLFNLRFHLHSLLALNLQSVSVIFAR